jgi:hypothetical protein
MYFPSKGRNYGNTSLCLWSPLYGSFALLQNSLPVTGPKGPLVTGKVPVTGNSSLVRGYQ